MMFGLPVTDSHQVEQILDVQAGFLCQFPNGCAGMGFAALDGTARQRPAAIGFANQEDVAIFLADDGRSIFMAVLDL